MASAVIIMDWPNPLYFCEFIADIHQHILASKCCFGVLKPKVYTFKHQILDLNRLFVRWGGGGEAAYSELGSAAAITRCRLLSNFPTHHPCFGRHCIIYCFM